MNIGKINSILMRTAAVLLMLVLVTSGMVSGRFARYVTTATYEDGARVARFSIVETGALSTMLQADIIPGARMELINVKNYSEVAVEFTITVDNVYRNIPLTFELKNGEQALAGTENIDGSVSFTGSIGPGQQEQQLQLYLIWTPGADSIDYIGRVDLVEITLDAVQID